MEMEVDNDNLITPRNNGLFLYYVMKDGLKKSRLGVNPNELSLEALRVAVTQELNSWEWKNGNEKPDQFDMLHRSRILKTDDEVKNIGPLSVVTVTKKIQNSSQEDHKSAKFIADYAKSRNIHDQLTQVGLALRTAFFKTNFVTMIENLGDSEMLENIFAIAPELRSDPVGIGIIQNPSLIYHLIDPDSLLKLANTRPWLIEAFNFIAASIHQEKGSSPSQGMPANFMFNQAMFDNDDELMEEDDDEGGIGGNQGAGPSQLAGSRITREQLSAALSALGGPSTASGGAGTGNVPSSNTFRGLFQPPSQPPPTANPPSGVGAAGANIQNLMNTLAGAGGGISGQALTSDIVARAVTDALRRLTPEQRADQVNAIRNFASQLQQSANPSAQQTQQPPAAQLPTSEQTHSPATPAEQYQSQLRQMREMGITDERLSILALRVSEGDVNTAVELIFSGWQGEGSDSLN